MAEKETVYYKVVEIGYVNGKKILHSIVASGTDKIIYTVGSWSKSKYPVLAFESLKDAKQFAYRETRFETTRAEIYICSAKNAASMSAVLDPWYLHNKELMEKFWNGSHRNGVTVSAPRSTVACSSVMLKECVASYPTLEV